MKIMHIANIRLPTEKAHGIQIMKMSEALAAAGAEIVLIVPRRSDNVLGNRDPFEYYSVKPNFSVKFLPSLDPGFLRKFRQGMFIKIQGASFLISLFFYLFFSGVRGKVLYTRNEYFLPVLLLFSRLVFWEPHTLPKNKSAYLRYWRKCQGIVAISRGLKDELVRLGVDEKKIIVAPDGVDLQKFSADEGRDQKSKMKSREQLGLPLDKKIIMYTGHLYEWKGARMLLEAAKYLRNQRLLFLFVGGTAYDIMRFKKQAAGIDGVLILGHRPYSEIPSFLAAADILVLPNSGKFEISRIHTSPLKLFEYMASGRPIVASDLPSIREVLKEQSAVLVKPDDVPSLAGGIQKILSDESLGQRIADEAKRVVGGYTWQERSKKILGMMAEVLTPPAS